MKRLACLLPLILTGCSYAYEVVYTVNVTSTTGTATGPLVLVLSEHHAGTGTQSDDLQVQSLSPEYTVTGKMGICCAPDPTVSLWAFVDTNRNMIWDVDEAKATDPRGVFILKDNTTTTLSIALKPLPPKGSDDKKAEAPALAPKTETAPAD